MLKFFSAVLSPDFSFRLYASLRSSWLAFCATFFALAFSLAAATFSLTALTGALTAFFSTPLGAPSRVFSSRRRCERLLLLDHLLHLLHLLLRLLLLLRAWSLVLKGNLLSCVGGWVVADERAFWGCKMEA
jgi:hypothetical protein